MSARARRALRALSVLHPVPSALVAVLVAVLALVAGGAWSVAGALAVAMLGFQFSIGALNDIADAEVDRRWQPRKPIPAGLVSPRLAGAGVALGAVVGLGISASFGIVVLALGAAGYLSGVAYDVVMRRAGLGWLCLAVALPLMLAWPWYAAAAALPPAWPLLLPLAALAGPALHLANSLVDVEVDEHAGRLSLATRLGPHGARRTLALLMVIILVLAWAALASLGTASGVSIGAAFAATLAIALGVSLSWRATEQAREAGWLLQAVGLATLATAWLTSMA